MNLSLTGGLRHSVTAVNGWQWCLMHPGGGASHPPSFIRPLIGCSDLDFCLLLPILKSIISITFPWSWRPCAMRGAGLGAALLPHKRLISFICDPIILGPSRKTRSPTDGYNGRWRLTESDVCNKICCSSVPTNQCQAALEMSSDSGPPGGWKTEAGARLFPKCLQQKAVVLV